MSGVQIELAASEIQGNAAKIVELADSMMSQAQAGYIPDITVTRCKMHNLATRIQMLLAEVEEREDAPWDSVE